MLWVDHVAGHHYVTLNTGLGNYLDSGQRARRPASGSTSTATYDGTNARYYVDGVQVATRTFTGNVGDFNTWRIGAYGGTRSASSTARSTTCGSTTARSRPPRSRAT